MRHFFSKACQIQKRGGSLNPPTLSWHFIDPSNRPADYAKWSTKWTKQSGWKASEAT